MIAIKSAVSSFPQDPDALLQYELLNNCVPNTTCCTYNCQASGTYHCCFSPYNPSYDCLCCTQVYGGGVCKTVPQVSNSHSPTTSSSISRSKSHSLTRSITPSVSKSGLAPQCPAGYIYNPANGLCCKANYYGSNICVPPNSPTGSLTPSPSFLSTPSPSASNYAYLCPSGYHYLPASKLCCPDSGQGSCVYPYTPSASPFASGTASSSPSATFSISMSISVTPTSSRSFSPSPTSLPSVTSSVTKSSTPSISITPSASAGPKCIFPIPGLLQEELEESLLLNSEQEEENKAFFVSYKRNKDQNTVGPLDYGKWCGSGHGGFQDCCNGTRCPGCIPSGGIISPQCVRECPPQNLIDSICMYHDSCTFQYPTSDSTPLCGSVISGYATNYCPCDCYFLAQMYNVDESNYCVNQNTYGNYLTCQAFVQASLYAFGCGPVGCFYNTDGVLNGTGYTYTEVCSSYNAEKGVYNNCIQGFWSPK